MRFGILVLLLFMPVLSSATNPVFLSAIITKPSATSSQFTFVLDKKTHGKVKYLPNPNRVIVELDNTRNRFFIKSAIFSQANVKTMHAEKIAEDGLRFIFLTNGYVKPTIHFLPAPVDQQIKLQLDILTAAPAKI